MPWNPAQARARAFDDLPGLVVHVLIAALRAALAVRIREPSEMLVGIRLDVGPGDFVERIAGRYFAIPLVFYDSRAGCVRGLSFESLILICSRRGGAIKSCLRVRSRRGFRF